METWKRSFEKMSEKGSQTWCVFMRFALLSMLSVLIASTENGRNGDCRDGNGLVLTQTDFGEKQLSLQRFAESQSCERFLVPVVKSFLIRISFYF